VKVGSMALNGNQSLEKRESPRMNWINPEVQVMIKSPNDNLNVLGWIQNISQGGFKVKVEISQNLKSLFGKREELHFETLEIFFRLKGDGRVVWISSNENMAGIKFDHLDEESRRFVDGFLGIFP